MHRWQCGIGVDELTTTAPLRRAPDRRAADIGGRASPVGAVVPLHEVGADLGRLGASCDAARLGGALAWAGEHAGEVLPGESLAQGTGRGRALVGQRQIRGSGVLAAERPRGLRMTRQNDVLVDALGVVNHGTAHGLRDASRQRRPVRRPLCLSQPRGAPWGLCHPPSPAISSSASAGPHDPGS